MNVYEEIFNMSLDMLCVAGNDGYFKELNPAWEKTLGYTKAELLARPYLELVHPEDREATLAAAGGLAAGSDIVNFENRYRCKDGGYKWLLWQSAAAREKGLVFAVARDITELKRSEEALLESEAAYRMLFENMAAGFAMQEIIYGENAEPLDYRFIEVNPAFENLLGLPASAIIGKSGTELFPQGWREIGAAAGDAARTGSPRSLQSWSGDLGKYLEINFYRAAGNCLALFLTDITERKKAELELKRTNNELRVISLCNQALIRLSSEEELVREICRIITEDGGYRMAWVGWKTEDEVRGVQPAGWAGHEEGYIAALNISWGDNERGRGPTGTALRTGKTVVCPDIAGSQAMAPWREGALKRGYASSIALPLAGESGVFGALNIYAADTEAFGPQDVHLLEELAGDLAYGINTLRRRAAQALVEKKLAENEAALRQAQKMELVGRLAGGIAHDFNNILTAIEGHAGFLRRSLRPDGPGLEDADGILHAAHRAAALTRQLLAFSRKQIMRPVTLALNESLRDMEKMLSRLIGEKYAVVFKPDPALAAVKADPGQLEQVVMNLVLNARDAMPGGGSITIETSNFQAGEAGAGPAILPPGGYIRLSVKDTGEGMAPEIQNRLFEPFFTTKVQGKGTGLGLSTVYGIVKQSGGYIFVDSAPGAGSTFNIYLPVCGEVLPTVPGRAAETESRGGAETILLVEDEEQVRKVVARMLKYKGYDVLEAADGLEALELFRAKGEGIALLITDLMMPKMDGLELARKLKAAHPGLKIIYTSGYTEEAEKLLADIEGGAEYLQKPVVAEALFKKVREVLGGTVD